MLEWSRRVIQAARSDYTFRRPKVDQLMLMMFAALYLSPRISSREEGHSAEKLASLAYEHSPRVEVYGHDLVVLDVEGLTHLWGGLQEIGERLRQAAADQKLVVRVAVAGSKMAAMLVTQHRCGLTVIPAGEEAHAVSTLPLTVVKQLMSSSSVIALLPIVQRWGLKTLGEFAALPTEELFSRLGPDGLELQRVARGEDSHPFVPETAEKRFEQTITLEWPVDGLEPLSFVLGRVLEPLCAQLDSCGVSVGALRVRLTLVSRDTHERTLRFPAPVSDAKVLRTLVLLDLESHPPSAGIDQVTVVADPVPTRTLQFSLLERAMPSPEQLSTLLARLTVLMGDQRCGSPGLVDTYWPGAFEMQSFTPKARPPIVLRQAQRDLSHGLQAVLRRFRVPVIARVTIERGQPVRVSSGLLHSESGRVVTCAGPWRSSGSWWTPSSLHASSFSASSWDHDEWDVALRDGGLYRIFQDRTTKRWFIEGVVD